MAPTRVISIVGHKDAGKTTLVVALAQEFGRRKRSVATIKHGHHPAIADTEGKDTWRHYHEGRAVKVLIEAPEQRVLFERTTQDADPITLARRYMSDVALVLVEGYHAAPLPKIEVFRSGTNQAPIYSPERPDAGLWVAIVTDQATLKVPVPVIRFADTSWLSTLAALAWDRALPLTT